MHDPFGGFFNKEKEPAGISSASPHIQNSFVTRRKSTMGFPIRRGSSHLFRDMPPDRAISTLMPKVAAALDPIPHTTVT